MSWNNRRQTTEGFWKGQQGPFGMDYLKSLADAGRLDINDLSDYVYEPVNDAVKKTAELTEYILSLDDPNREVYKTVFSALGYADAEQMADEVIAGSSVADVVANHTAQRLVLVAGSREFATAADLETDLNGRTEAGQAAMLGDLKISLKRGDTTEQEIDISGICSVGGGLLTPSFSAAPVTTAVSSLDKLFDQLPTGSWRYSSFDGDGNPVREVLFWKKKPGKFVPVSATSARKKIDDDDAEQDEFFWSTPSQWIPRAKGQDKGKKFDPVPGSIVNPF